MHLYCILKYSERRQNKSSTRRYEAEIIRRWGEKYGEKNPEGFRFKLLLKSKKRRSHESAHNKRKTKKDDREKFRHSIRERENGDGTGGAQL